MFSWISKSDPNVQLLVTVPDSFAIECLNNKELMDRVQDPEEAISVLKGENKKFDEKIVQKMFELYALIHSEYLKTDEGLVKIHQKYLNKEFGTCPRSLCHKCQCLPYGVRSKIGELPIKWYCPNCSDLYSLKDTEIGCDLDGAFFGPSYVINLLGKYPNIIPKELPEVYEPRIFGFRMCPIDPSSESDSN